MKDTLKYLVREAEVLRDGGYLTELPGANIGANRLLA